MVIDIKEREQLRAEVRRFLKTSHPLKSNITKDKIAAVKDLKKDDTIITLLEGKVKATVIMDVEEYEDKVRAMLSEGNSFEKLASDPTSKYKMKFVAILDELKQECQLIDPE